MIILGMTVWSSYDSSHQALRKALILGLSGLGFRSAIKLVQEQRRSEGRVSQAAGLDMIQTVGGFGLGVILALFGFGGGSVLAGAGLVALICLPFFAREDWKRAIKGRFSRIKAKQYAHYGFPIALSLILSLVLYTCDRFLIAHYLSAADAGAYGAGYSLASRILDVLFIWFGAAGEPALINALESGGLEAMQKTARQMLRTMALILFPAVAGLIALTPALGSILIGGGLRERAVMVAPLITLGALFAGFNSYYFLKAFPLARRTGWLVAAMAIPALLNIALNMVLIPIMGLKGSAYATLISFVLGTISTILLGSKGHALPIAWRDLILTAIASIVMMGMVSVLPNWHNTIIGAFAELGVKGGAGVLIYAGLAWGLNLGQVRDLDLKALWMKRRSV